MGTREVLRLSSARRAAATGEARDLRLRAHLSLADVGDTCGVDQSTVYRWERGLRAPSGAAALRYATLLEALRQTIADTAAAS